MGLRRSFTAGPRGILIFPKFSFLSDSELSTPGTKHRGSHLAQEAIQICKCRCGSSNLPFPAAPIVGRLVFTPKKSMYAFAWTWCSTRETLAPKSRSGQNHTLVPHVHQGTCGSEAGTLSPYPTVLPLSFSAIRLGGVWSCALEG